MTEKNLFSIRVAFTAFVTIFILSLITWDFFHGGIPKHHLLHRKELPAISNAWSALLLPLLTWLLLLKINRKLIPTNLSNPNFLNDSKKMLIKLVVAIFFGVLVSVFFTIGYSNISSYMFQSLFLLALFIPLHKAEYFLGFVLGMAYTFGGVLPILIGGIILLILTAIHLYIRGLIIFVINKIKQK